MIPRQSNFELLRIFSMLLVVLLHANYFALGNISPEEVAQFPVTAAVRIFCEQACIVCVNRYSATAINEKTKNDSFFSGTFSAEIM